MVCDPFIRRCDVTDPTDLVAMDARMAEFEELHINGGALHVVVEDSNWEDHHIESCLERARENVEGLRARVELLREKGEIVRADMEAVDATGHDQAIALGELLLKVPIDARRRWFCNCGCMTRCEVCAVDPENNPAPTEVCYLRKGLHLCAEHAGQIDSGEIEWP